MAQKSNGRGVVLSIVVPCYNEEAVISTTYAQLTRLLERLVAVSRISPHSEIVFVDDGSSDATWDFISGFARRGGPVVALKLSRNCGHQNALLAGLTTARGDAVVTIDADLQDDEIAIESMLSAFQDGYEIVYGVRAARDCDTWFKRTTARMFYQAMLSLGVSTVYDHADYRLLSRRAVECLRRFEEANLFLRGIVPLIGLRSTVVRYARRARKAGESKYPLRKMIEFAVDGITSFSVRPLRAITGLGFSVSLGCALLALWAVCVRMFSADAVPGWASTILPIYFVGGVQLFCLGVIGEYVGKIYMESKRRPRFFVEKLESGESATVEAIQCRSRPIRPRRTRSRATAVSFPSESVGSLPVIEVRPRPSESGASA